MIEHHDTWVCDRCKTQVRHRAANVVPYGWTCLDVLRPLSSTLSSARQEDLADLRHLCRSCSASFTTWLTSWDPNADEARAVRIFTHDPAGEIRSDTSWREILGDPPPQPGPKE